MYTKDQLERLKAIAEKQINGFTIPDPSPEYQDFVRKLIAEANGQRCKECDCLVDNYTRGCHTCGNRHAYRRAHGLEAVDRPKICARCGTPYDEQNIHCHVCRTRHALRRRKGSEAVPMTRRGAAKVRGVCLYCSLPYAECEKTVCKRGKNRITVRRTQTKRKNSKNEKFRPNP